MLKVLARSAAVLMVSTFASGSCPGHSNIFLLYKNLYCKHIHEKGRELVPRDALRRSSDTSYYTDAKFRFSGCFCTKTYNSLVG